MNEKRLDFLVEVMLATGSLPPDASELERAQVTALLAVAATVRTATPSVEAEAAETMPVARARFQRYLASQESIARTPGRLHRWRWPATAALFARVATTRAVAAIVVLAIAALVASQFLTSDVGTASAQVVTPGDYVQLEGTVTSQTTDNGVRRVRLVSDAGEFDVDVSNDSSVVAGQVPADPAVVQVGDHILVGGVVNQGGQVGARTLVVASQTGPKPPTQSSPRVPRKVKTADRPLEGRIVSFALSADLKTARVVLDDGNGGIFLARINRKSAEAMMLQSVNVLGAYVRLVGGGAPGLFGLVVVSDATPSPTGTATGGATTATVTTAAVTTAVPTTVKAAPTRPTVTPGSGATPRAAASQASAAFVEVKGTILGRENNVLRVQTERGTVLVVLRADTRILPGDTGATLQTLRSGGFNPVGYTLGVAGGFDAKTDRISADLVVFGGKSAP